MWMVAVCNVWMGEEILKWLYMYVWCTPHMGPHPMPAPPYNYVCSHLIRGTPRQGKYRHALNYAHSTCIPKATVQISRVWISINKTLNINNVVCSSASVTGTYITATVLVLIKIILEILCMVEGALWIYNCRVWCIKISGPLHVKWSEPKYVKLRYSSSEQSR